MWTASSRTHDVQKGDWFVFTGTAYPRVVPGKNRTDIVTSSSDVREDFYNDPAVTLSEANLDDYKGAEGLPLCVEHDPTDVVGRVQHSWLKNGALKIVGQVDLRTERGRDVAASIKDGTYKGLSVGYDFRVDEVTGQLTSKRFNEISIVERPFFKGCDLAYSVAASGAKPPTNPGTTGGTDGGTRKGPYLGHQYVYCTIEMADASTATPTTAVSGDELLTEVHKLKTQQEEAAKAKAQMEQELVELRRQKEEWAAEQKRLNEQYAAEQLPKAEHYIAVMSADGKTMTEENKASWKLIFCSRETAAHAKELEAQAKYVEGVRASAASSAQELKEMKEKLAQMESAVARSTQVLSSSRSTTKEALAPDAGTQQQQVTASGTGASDIPAGHMAVNPPHESERHFLQAFGYYRTGSDGHSVTASGSAGPARQAPRSIPLAPEHPLLYDEKGESALPGSLRWQKGNPFFHILASSKGKLDEALLRSIVKPVAAKNEWKRHDSLDHINMSGAAGAAAAAGAQTAGP